MKGQRSQFSIQNSNVSKHPKVNLNLVEVNQVVEKLDAVVSEELQDVDACNIEIYCVASRGVENKVEGNDCVKQNADSESNIKEEKFRTFSQWTQCMYSRLNGIKKKMAFLMETRVKDIYAKITEVQDVIKNEVNLKFEDKYHREKTDAAKSDVQQDDTDAKEVINNITNEVKLKEFDLDENENEGSKPEGIVTGKMITSIEENIRDRGGDGDNRTFKRKVEVGNAEHGRIADVESAKEPDVESVKETGIAVVTPFTYSEEGLLRLIRLDLGILNEKELDTNCKTVGNSLDYNIKSEEMFEPPSKKFHNRQRFPCDRCEFRG